MTGPRTALPATPRRPGPSLAVLTVATLATVTAELLPSALLPAMSRDLGVSEAAIGGLVSAWAVTIAVLGVPLVRATLRVPRTLLLTAALAATAPATLVTALAPDLTVALVGRVLAATAHGLFWALVVTTVASLVEPARLGRALAVVLSGPTLAGLAALPAAALLADLVGWRAVVAGLSVVLALAALLLRLVLPRDTGTPAPVPDPAGTRDRSAAAVLAVAAAGGLVLVGHFSAFTYVTALVTGLGGFDGSAVAALLLVFGLAGGVGVVVSGAASDRFPAAAPAAAAGLVALGLGVLRLGDGRPVVFAVGTAVWGLAVGAFPPILQAHVLRLSSPAFRPLAGGVLITVLNLGIAAGAALGGVALGLGGATLTAAALVAAAAGAAVLALLRPPPSGARVEGERAAGGGA
jgi:predicted MFS family arabinose efflux permease